MGESRAPTAHQVQDVRIRILKGRLDHGTQLQWHNCRGCMIGGGAEHSPTVIRSWPSQPEPLRPWPARLLSMGPRTWYCVHSAAIPAFRAHPGPRHCLGSFAVACPLPYAQGAPAGPLPSPSDSLSCSREPVFSIEGNGECISSFTYLVN